MCIPSTILELRGRPRASAQRYGKFAKLGDASVTEIRRLCDKPASAL
jgi:hypothetical protein